MTMTCTYTMSGSFTTCSRRMTRSTLAVRPMYKTWGGLEVQYTIVLLVVVVLIEYSATANMLETY